MQGKASKGKGESPSTVRTYAFYFARLYFFDLLVLLSCQACAHAVLYLATGSTASAKRQRHRECTFGTGSAGYGFRR